MKILSSVCNYRTKVPQSIQPSKPRVNANWNCPDTTKLISISKTWFWFRPKTYEPLEFSELLVARTPLSLAHSSICNLSHAIKHRSFPPCLAPPITRCEFISTWLDLIPAVLRQLSIIQILFNVFWTFFKRNEIRWRAISLVLLNFTRNSYRMSSNFPSIGSGKFRPESFLASFQ